MVTMRNFIAKYPGKKDGIIVLASHYETNYPLKDINFVGADDGACTTALLIAIGQYLREHPPQGYSVWLLFDDGEEAIGNDGMDRLRLSFTACGTSLPSGARMERWERSRRSSWPT